MLDLLTKFGVPEKEARIYLALLEMGPSSVSEVAKRAKVPRTNSLQSRGLVSSSNENSSKMVFAGEDPKRLIQMLKSKSEEFHRLYLEAKDHMPEFRSIYNQKDGKLKVRFYEGVEGVISAYEDTLGSKTEILGFASVEHQHDFFPGYFPTYYTRRTKQGIPVRCFLANSEESQRIQDLDKAHLRETYLVPPKYAISPEINIYDNKVAIMSLKEKFGAIIESEEVADAFRNIFELSLERAAQYDKEFREERKRKEKKSKDKKSKE